MSTIDELAAAKLHPDEVATIREAADVLLFTDAVDPDVEGAARAVGRLLGQLEESGRWSAESCSALADELAACGPAAALSV